MIRLAIDKWAVTARNRVNELLDTFKEVDKFVRQRIGGWSTVLEGLAASFTAVFGAKMIGGIVQSIGGLVVGLNALITMLVGLGVVGGTAGGLGLVVGAIAALAIGIGQVVAALGSLVLLWEDFNVFLQGGDSLLGLIVSQFGDKEKVARTVSNTLELLKGLFWEFFEAGKATAILIKDVLVEAFKLLWFVMGPLVTWLAQTGFDTMLAGLQQVNAALRTMVGFMKAANESGFLNAILGANDSNRDASYYDQNGNVTGFEMLDRLIGFDPMGGRRQSVQNNNFVGGNLVLPSGVQVSPQQVAALRKQHAAMTGDQLDMMSLRVTAADFNSGVDQ